MLPNFSQLRTSKRSHSDLNEGIKEILTPQFNKMQSTSTEEKETYTTNEKEELSKSAESSTVEMDISSTSKDKEKSTKSTSSSTTSSSKTKVPLSFNIESFSTFIDDRNTIVSTKVIDNKQLHAWLFDESQSVPRKYRGISKANKLLGIDVSPDISHSQTLKA